VSLFVRYARCTWNAGVVVLLLLLVMYCFIRASIDPRDAASVSVFFDELYRNQNMFIAS